MTKTESWRARITEPTLWPMVENDDKENLWCIKLLITHDYIRNNFGGVVDCFTRDKKKVVGSSPISGNVLCP